jgi:transposase
MLVRTQDCGGRLDVSAQSQRVEQSVFIIRASLDLPVFTNWRCAMKAMEVVHPCCCGLDVHKDSVVACIRRMMPDGEARELVRTFGTTTAALLELGDWLVEQQVPIAAMESTGVYWKPVWNLLEDRLQLMLVNSQQTKPKVGHKTDVKDGRWIAQLLSCGLLHPSFVPPQDIRELRDLTRGRTTLMQDKSRVANRLQKVLEDCNVKLASVASDVLGVSGREMIEALIEGKQTPAQMAQLARKQMRSKIPQLTAALDGKLSDHHRFMLRMAMDQIKGFEAQIALLDERIGQVMSPLQRTALNLLDEIPGVDQRAAQNIIAEIGVDMDVFPSEQHLASWAGVCPGNNQSGGKRKSGRITQGNRWLKATLNQCAWAAGRKKDSYLSAQFRRVCCRRGVKRANMAVAHTILCVCWQLINHQQAYNDLGRNYLDRREEDRIKRQTIRRLEKLGYSVTLIKSQAA